VCVPVYAVYGLRNDGPLLDRAVQGICR
jgi:hypothetical protein